MRRLINSFSAFLFKKNKIMKNNICVIEKRFDRFDLLYFENLNDKDDNFYKVYRVTDTVYAKSKNEFKTLIESISVKRMEYLNFWREYAKQDVLAIYDEITEKHLDIEKEIQYMDDNTCFIIRRNDLAINYLNEVDLNIELNRLGNNNWNFIHKKFNALDNKLEKRLDLIENSVRLKQYHLGFKLTFFE